MGLHEAIVTRADNFAGLMALIGSPARIYPATGVKQGTSMPYVVFQQISGARHHTMGLDTVAQPRIQFDCFAGTRLDALAVRDQVLAAFDRWSGIFAGVQILATVVESDGIDIERDDTTLVPRETVEVIVSYVR